MALTDDHDAESPRDILAAEAFAVGMGDPGLHRVPARDVLAADEFPLPAPRAHAVPPEWQQASGASGASDQFGAGGRRGKPGRVALVGLLAGAVLFAAARRFRRRNR
jgi:hypothetical protein